jgi:hypothetical protein
MKALLCALVGHRWRPAKDVHESQPVLQCRRCRCMQSFAAETRDPAAWGAGRARGRSVGKY